MSFRSMSPLACPVLALCLLGSVLSSAQATPPGKMSFYALHMDPTGAYGDFAANTYGGGVEVAFSLPGAAGDYVAWDLGTEFVNFNRADYAFRDPVSGLSFLQRTSQSFLRVYTGLQFGLLRAQYVQPYVSAHVALAEHNLSPVFEVPQNPTLAGQLLLEVDDSADWGFAYDVTAGVHVPFFQEMGVYGGIKYVDNETIRVRRGQEFVDAEPAYIQAFLGLAYDFGFSRPIQ